MSTAQKKTTAKKSAASTAKKTTTASAADTVVDFNNQAMKNIQSSLTSEAQKAQEKMTEMSQQSAEQFAKSADAAGTAFYDAINSSRETMEACVESGNIAASIAKEVGEELSEYANQTATDSVELSKEFFSCRTLNDVVELQNKVVKSSVETYFEQCSRMSSAMFESFNEIAEPIGQRISESTEQFSKALNQK